MTQQQWAAARDSTPFSIDPGDELPVGLQLSWRLKALIRTGRLAEGDQLPSFRRLAEWAGVNVNTVRGVYAGLEEDGLVVSRQGQGTFVADGVESHPEVEQIATEALRSAHDAGIDPRDLVVVAMACAGMAVSPSKEAAASAVGMPSLVEESEVIEVRQELRRQIARLEAELAAYVRDLPDDRRTAPRFAKAHVAGVEELEQTRDELIVQLSEAQKAAELRARQEGEARLKRQAMHGTGGQASFGGGALGEAMSWWRRRP